MVTQPQVEGTPGTTFFNQITLTNATDSVSHVRLTLSAPAAFRLLTQLPATVTIQPHSSVRIPLKFLIDRDWNADEAVVRIETVQLQQNTAPGLTGSAIEFVVHQNRDVPSVLTFTLENESPYFMVGQDTLPVTLRFSNQGPYPRTVRLQLFSIPSGFRLALPYHVLTIGARRDTLIQLNCLAGGSVQWDRSYDLAIEVQDYDQVTKPRQGRSNDRSSVSGPETGALLGSVVCHPVMLTSVRHWLNARQNGIAPMGIALGLSRFGMAGLVREVRFWGQEAIGKGKLTYQAHYLNYASQHYHELRDTYLQYQQTDFMVRVGSIYDYHELSLIGVGVKVSRSLTENTKLEGWALRNQSNWLANLTTPVGGLTQSTPDMTYSLRLSGKLPLPGESFYELSSSYFTQRRVNRSSMLNFATVQWLPDPNSKIKLLTGQSVEYSPGQPNRRQTLGWALGGGYERTTKPVDVHVSAYFSTPGYSGIQRGAFLIEHSLSYKKWATTQLGYRYSQVSYNQQLYTSPNEQIRRQYGNTIVDVSWSQRLGRFSTFVRPYYWMQSQTLPAGTLQRADSYRILTSLRYESLTGVRAEAGVDAGRFEGKAPPTDRFNAPSYRYVSSVGIHSFNLMAIYQRGPFLLNDRLPGQGDPRLFRQVSIMPAYRFSLFDGRLQANMGAGLTYNTVAKSWNGLLYNTATFAVNDGLRFRVDVNALSYAANLANISSVPWQESQVRFEVMKLFQRSPWKAPRTLRLRFFEDENGNLQKDPNESYVDGLVVNVGPTSMITDKKGIITYKDIAVGTYPIRAVCRVATGELVWFQDTVRVLKSVQRDMPIRKTWRVVGQLNCKQARYENQTCELDQYKIETSGPEGESFRTYADETGQFTLYLPVGQYQVNVTSVQLSALHKTVGYRIEPGKEPHKLTVDVDASSRPIQIKRFSTR